MRLTVEEAAALLAADPERVYDWIEEGGLPAQRIRGQYRINRTEMLEWATERGIAVAPQAFAPAEEEQGPSLADALRSGRVHYGVPGGDRATVTRSLIALLPLEDEADRDTVLQFLAARDALGVTAVGGGIAIPHVRMPIVLSPSGFTALLAFLDGPVDLPSPDGTPIDTLFFLVSPTVHAHLALLASLAFCLKKPAFREVLRRRAPAEEIIRAAEEAGG
jgi:PTS system nitrogen regulatory IIA component